jgi:RNA methyltransferase, TrmH family
MRKLNFRENDTMTQPNETIRSLTNPLVKTLKSLERKKGRADNGLFLAEGARVIAQGLARGWACETLLVASSVADRAHVTALCQTAADAGARIAAASDAVMEKITHKDNAQSCIASFRQQPLTLAALPVPARANPLYIALWEVRDPGNLGTILRTADCAGVDGVILLETCCDPYSFEAVRASMGSLFDMPLARADRADFGVWRQANACQLVAASINGVSRHDATPMTGPTIILMGNEQAGLPASIEGGCDRLVRLPMRGGADSLNLAQATAIMTYEAWRQRDFT